jgi:cyclopropane fatty-acyl-phospholipid synthase-like methyltransferase
MALLIEPLSSSPPAHRAGAADRLDLPTPPPRVPSNKRVQTCYALMHIAEGAGIRDLADGEYTDADQTLEEGIVRQNDYLLDEVGCTRPGFRLLEIGCGYGRLLRQARQRGAVGVGVNISPEQVRDCCEQGLEVHCCNYRDLFEASEWRGRFDGVVANGSLEHWVQPEDVKAGRMNAIYNESFAIAHRMIDPQADEARYVTTAIHVPEPLDPDVLLTDWRRLPKGSAERMFSLLHHWFGGYYPTYTQLAECAQPYFTLEKQTDGTTGYGAASQYRMSRMRRAIVTKPKVLWNIAKALTRHPQATVQLLYAYFIEEAWDWQFRGETPPTRLLRQTWRRNPSLAS